MTKYWLGKHHSEEYKKKMSQSCSGDKNFWFGKHLSKEHKAKLSIIKKGKKPSKETRERMSKSKIGNKNSLGNKLSDETKTKISKAQKGKKVSELTRMRMREASSGSNNANWKGGITSESRKMRNSAKLQLWHKVCLQRDNLVCQKCSQCGGQLEVHHINNFADFPELRLISENGITLCKGCHKEFHHIYGKKNNTQEQLNELLNNYTNI